MDFGSVVKNIIAILFLTWLFFRLYVSIFKGRSNRFVGLLLGLAGFWAISYILEFTFFIKAFEYLYVPIMVAIIIAYSPEIRMALVTEKRRGNFFRSNSTTASQVDIALTACWSLREKKRGALIVFSRNVPLKSFIETGTKIDSEMSLQMLMTIFAFDTELHDGAVIIQNGRLAAAGCFLPLSHQQDLNQAFGTRHRAALGMSEESDALVLIVSEESGAVSIAFNGTMYYDLEKDTARNMLISLLSAQDVNTSFKEASNEEQ